MLHTLSGHPEERPMTEPTPARADHVAANRAAWDGFAADYAEAGRRNWAAAEPTWGIFAAPEADIGMLPPDLHGMDAVELGCGTAYVSAWLARRGARPVGIDNSPKQLETARAFQAEFGLAFPLHLGNAERTPFPDAAFDFAVSEYGASIWCDPYAWIPEAARILRPGGRLRFLVNSVLLMLCSGADEDAPVGTTLERPLFGMHRFTWEDGSVEFHMPHGEMIRLLRANGFEVEDLVEVRPPEGATTTYPFVTPEWAGRWPCEEVWKARKR
jgi:SAM-dependent methyltransferase